MYFGVKCFRVLESLNINILFGLSCLKKSSSNEQDCKFHIINFLHTSEDIHIEALHGIVESNSDGGECHLSL